jgi:hypothetical protein
MECPAIGGENRAITVLRPQCAPKFSAERTTMIGHVGATREAQRSTRHPRSRSSSRQTITSKILRGVCRPLLDRTHPAPTRVSNKCSSSCHAGDITGGMTPSTRRSHAHRRPYEFHQQPTPPPASGSPYLPDFAPPRMGRGLRDGPRPVARPPPRMAQDHIRRRVAGLNRPRRTQRRRPPAARELDPGRPPQASATVGP